FRDEVKPSCPPRANHDGLVLQSAPSQRRGSSMKNALLPILALMIVAPAAIAQRIQGDAAARIDALLERMTLEEKLGQLQQLGGDPKTGMLLDGQRDLIQQGRIGSLLN